jgi:hypothetical protein
MSGWEFTDEPRRPDIGSGLVSELLKPLADADLVEYCRSWVWDRYRYEAAGNGFSVWNCGKRLSTGYAEVRRRGIDVDALHAAIEADYLEREHESVPGVGRGDPILGGLVKIDFDDDDAVAELSRELAAEIVGAVKDSGLRFKPRSDEEIARDNEKAQKERETLDAIEAGYRAVVSLVPPGVKFGSDQFLSVLDQYLLSNDDASLSKAVDLIRTALEWADIDLSEVDLEEGGSDVVDMAATHLVSFEYDEYLGDSLLMLDLGRGVTYVCVDSNEDRAIYAPEILAQVEPDDWDTVRGLGIDAMTSGMRFGEPLGKAPDTVAFSYPLTRDDVYSAIRDAFESMDRRETLELAEWMSQAGHEMLPVETKHDRSALIDAFLESLKVREG